MIRCGGLLAATLLLALPAFGEAPGRSPRPQPAPGPVATPTVSATTAAAAQALADSRADAAQSVQGGETRTTTAAVRTVVEQVPVASRSVLAPRVSAQRPRTRPSRPTGVARSPAVARDSTPRGATPVATRAPAADGGLLADLFDGKPPSPAPEPTIVSGPQAPSEETVVASASAERPAQRPRGLAGLFRRAAQPAPRYPTSGSVCGDRSIRGKTVGKVPGSGSCGIDSAVRITEISGVKLSSPATIDCTTAQALKTWIETAAVPAVGNRGGGLAGLKVAAHYACRTRNNKRGARLSEHAKGRAIDISAIQLADGSAMTVLRGWRSKSQGPVLRKMHAGACGPFGTVLGPNADRHHQDHFHFDTARYRSGAYCR